MTLQTRADQLYTALFGTWKGPKRASRMTGRADQKYIDIPTYSFGPEHFAAHLAGRDTYAGTLGLLGEARTGCKDYDDAGEAEHLPATLAQAGAAQEVARADVLISQVEGLRNKAIGILLKAEKAGELRTALMAIREAREILVLLLEVEGRLDRRPVNILVAPQWLELRTVLIQTLAPFPEARVAVVEALHTHGH
jgi:hypothetical protein